MDGSAFDPLYSFGVTTNMHFGVSGAIAQTLEISWSTGDAPINAIFSATSVSLRPLIVIANAEEDYEDIRDSDAALAEARAKGTKSWRQIKKELGR
jgi:hypothetical protein